MGCGAGTGCRGWEWCGVGSVLNGKSVRAAALTYGGGVNDDVNEVLGVLRVFYPWPVPHKSNVLDPSPLSAVRSLPLGEGTALQGPSRSGLSCSQGP